MESQTSKTRGVGSIEGLGRRGMLATALLDKKEHSKIVSLHFFTEHFRV